MQIRFANVYALAAIAMCPGNDSMRARARFDAKPAAAGASAARAFRDQVALFCRSRTCRLSVLQPSVLASQRFALRCLVGLLGLALAMPAEAMPDTGPSSKAAPRTPSSLEAARRLRRVPYAVDRAAWIHPPLFELHLTAEQRNADLAPDLVDAILRIEGVFDPTRQGVFGPALRMAIRAGTASMTDVFGERWRRADEDPNLHVRVAYLAQEWLQPTARDCADFRRFRPNDVAIALDMPSHEDCARLAKRSASYDANVIAVIASRPTALPIFAAPYPGSRFTPEELRMIVEAHLRAVKARAWWSGASR